MGTKGRSGRKRKPYGLKLLEGTAKPGDEPEVEFPVLADGEPPHWVKEENAVEEWCRLYPLLSSTRILTEGDRTELGHLCNLHGKIVKKWLADDMPSGTILARLQSMLCDFGLNPASRGRVKPVGKADSENAFTKLRKDA